ncbi:MAG: adenosylcobinamide-GDP ribazoletransferase [Pseudomonadota bacterium]
MNLPRRLNEIRLAAMFLTRLPVGRLRDPVPVLADCAWAFPLIGLPVGLAGWAVQAGALWLGLPALVAALAAVAAMALLTGALHHDGLADVADGFGGGRTADRALEIMRDSRIGSYGTLALVLAVGLEAAALAGIAGGAPLSAFLLIAVASRVAMLAALLWMPAVRQDGLGHSAVGPGPGALGIGGLLVLACAVPLGAAALPVLACAGLGALSVARRALRRIGGQTGDVLGAVQVVSAVSGWLAASALLGP